MRVNEKLQLNVKRLDVREKGCCISLKLLYR